jgi:hypothetical protein
VTAPPGLSQSSAPFVASWRQDIPHTPLVAWPHRPHAPAPRVATKDRALGPASPPDQLPSRGRRPGVTILLSLRLVQRSHDGQRPRWDDARRAATLPLPKLSKSKNGSVVLHRRAITRTTASREVRFGSPEKGFADLDTPRIGLKFLRANLLGLGSLVRRRNAVNPFLQNFSGSPVFPPGLEMTGFEPVTSWLQTTRSPN